MLSSGSHPNAAYPNGQVFNVLFFIKLNQIKEIKKKKNSTNVPLENARL